MVMLDKVLTVSVNCDLLSWAQSFMLILSKATDAIAKQITSICYQNSNRREKKKTVEDLSTYL